MKHVSLLLLSWLLTAVPARAQSPNAAALRRVLADLRQPDTLRANAALELSRTQTDFAAKQRLEQQALALVGTARSTAPLRRRILTNIAHSQAQTGHYADALRTFQELLALGRRLRDPSGQVLGLRGMAGVRENMGDFAGAVPMYRQALAVPGISPESRLYTQAALSNVLGAADPQAGPPEAEKLIRRTLVEARAAYAAGACSEAKYQIIVAMAGRIMLDRERPAEAVALVRRRLAEMAPVLARTPVGAENVGVAADLYLTLADGLVMQRAFPEAVRECRTALDLLRRAGLQRMEVDLLPVLVMALEGTGDYRGALRYQQQLTTLTDSLATVARTNEALRLQTQFETREKEARIRTLGQREKLAQALAARRRQQLWGVVAVLLAVLAGAGVGAWLFVRLRRAQGHLQHLTQLKDQLFAIIGHDLRAPVAGFRQAVPLLYGLADYPEPAEQRALTRAIDESSAQLADLLDNLLHWGRVQTQALTVRPETVDVAALLRAEARLVQATADAKQVRLHVAANALPPLLTDPTLLRVVVRNLLTNALKYSPPGGEVTLGAEAIGSGGVALTVQDTGVGMTAVTLAAVLNEAGAVVSRRGTAGEAGTGLGLRVARAFARELGAALSAVSQPGAGTTFRLALPAGG